jgi:transcriptional repressor NrdR
MKCPKCQNTYTKVIDSRVLDNCVKRRRQCISCNYRFSTYENPQPLNLKVIKKNGRTEIFDKQKIKNGLVKSLNKRPFSPKDIDKILCEIEHTIYQKHSKKVKTSQIGKIILDKLYIKDEIAYLRFASVYKNFKSITTFSKEIHKIKEK